MRENTLCCSRFGHDDGGQGRRHQNGRGKDLTVRGDGGAPRNCMWWFFTAALLGAFAFSIKGEEKTKIEKKECISWNALPFASESVGRTSRAETAPMRWTCTGAERETWKAPLELAAYAGAHWRWKDQRTAGSQWTGNASCYHEANIRPEHRRKEPARLSY